MTFSLPWRILLLAWVLAGGLWGQHQRDRVMLGEDLFVAEGEEVVDVVCIGCSIRVDGRVLGDAVAIAGSLDIRGRVRGDAVAVMGSVELHPKAAVDGDVVAVMGRATIPDDADVGGDIVSGGDFAPIALSGLLVALLLSLVAALLVQPLLVLICFLILGPERLQVLADTARQRAGLSFLFGAGLVIGSFMLTVLLSVIPLAVPGLQFPLGLAMFIILVVGYAGISYWVGRSLVGGSGPLAAALLGAVLVTILQLIPIVGWVAFMIFSMMALGSAVLSGFGTSVDWLTQRTKTHPVTPGG